MFKIILVIILILLILVLLYKYLIIGSGNGAYIDYKINFPHKILPTILKHNIPVLTESLKYYNTQKHDITFKDEFCLAFKIYSKQQNIESNIFVEYDNSVKNEMKIKTKSSEMIYEDFKISNKNSVIFLEANEKYSSHHWYKSICSDIRNICSILHICQKCKNIDLIKNHSFGTFQANYNDEFVISPFHSNTDLKDSTTPTNCKFILRYTFIKMIEKFYNIKQNGHYYILFSSFIDGNNKLILNNNISKNIVDIDLIKLIKNQLSFQEILIKLIYNYTTLEHFNNYSFTNESYKNLFEEILNNSNIELIIINGKVKLINDDSNTKLNEYVKLYHTSFINKNNIPLTKNIKTCIYPDAYAFINL